MSDAVEETGAYRSVGEPASLRELATPERQLWHFVASRPCSAFITLSLVFGIFISLVVPPLRGPDEIAHYLRIHSYAQGMLLPSTEVDGRKGMFVPAELHAQLTLYKEAGERFAREREGGLRYGALLPELAEGSDSIGEIEASIFLAFAGTEGYSPAVYFPYIVAAKISEFLGLTFVAGFMLMRVLGVLAFTGAIALAIYMTPALKWAFVLIGMLPVALYNRSVLSADGAALASAFVITALCFGGVRQLRSAWPRSLAMTWCILTKQPQIVFLLLELLVRPKSFRSFAAVLVPSLLLWPLWILGVSADVAAWRLQVAETHPPEQFDPLWKLAFMWEHPLHFPWATWNAITMQGSRLWQELLGILGWQDILLSSWIYACLTILLLLVPLQQLRFDPATIRRIAAITGSLVISYIAFVYLIFFLTYTPTTIDHVRGVQGRYFVIVLPPAAIFLAAILNRSLSREIRSAAAIAGALLSGIACCEALFRAHWLV